MNPFIFRREDIRGIVGQDFSYDDARLIGAAFGTILRRGNCDSCFVGRDNRLSSEKITNSLIAGLLSTGVNVRNIGLATTPMVYWTRYYYGFGEYGSVEITGSHNPPEYNGVKPCFKGATTLEDNDIQELCRLSVSHDFAPGEGALTNLNIVPDYFNDLRQSLQRVPITPIRTLKVVVDSGNAVGGIFAPKFYRDLGYEVVELHSRLDGTFPNHLPDPSVGANLQELVAWVRDQKADIGLAFDGDVDRLNVVDETGYVVWGDGLIALLARTLLRDHPSEPILFNTQCSPGLEEDILSHGGKPVCVPTGHARVSDYIKHYQAKLAGEYKGHLYLADYFYGLDDAIYAGARVLKILAASKEPLSKLLAGVPAYKATGEIFIPTTDEKKFVITKKVGEELKKKYFVSDLEGDLRIKFGGKLVDTWGMVRHSDTQPKIEVYAWSKLEENLTAARDIMVNEVSKYL